MLNGGEVVEVSFDPKRISFAKLLQHAEDNECASKVIARTDAQLKLATAKVGDRASRSDKPIAVDKDVKYYLSKHALAALPMTELQAARVNASLESGDWKQWLSPLQLALFGRLQVARVRQKDFHPPSAIGRPIIEAWEDLDARLAHVSER